MEPCKISGCATGASSICTAIKFCGLTRPEDIETVNALKPDFAGFVFAKSRRQISGQQAEQLKAMLSPEIQAVGVFVNAAPEEIAELAEGSPGHPPVIDLIQLHGDEDETYIKELRNRTDKPIIKAVHVVDGSEIPAAEALPCEYLLLDTFTKGMYGGSGKQFDWKRIPALSKPWFLAGGIGEENLAEAVKLHPYCIDLSSALETEGKKDSEKMRRMMALFQEYSRR